MSKLLNVAKNEKIQLLLREKDDSPHVIYHTERPLRIQRHGRGKKVMLVATSFNLYLIKVKGMRFYGRWPNTCFLTTTSGNSITIRIDKEWLDEVDPDGKRMFLSYGVGGEFESVELLAASSDEMLNVQHNLKEISRNARAHLQMLETPELRPENGNATCAGGKKVTFEEADEEESDDEDEEDDENSWGQGQQPQQQATHPWQREGTQSSLFQKAPSRYLAVTSIVDGEFTDYSTLKNAYIREEEDTLLEDITTFIDENKGQVEKLCERYYPVFLDAARQCMSISEDDAELVGQELSGATALVRSSAIKMKRAAADLSHSLRVRDNLAQVRSLLHGALEVAEHLEATETRLRQQQLLGAVVSLKQLLQMATPLVEYALGDYVINQRAPEMAQEIFNCAVQHLNLWLRNLREMSLPIGTAGLMWKGAVEPGFVEKKLHTTDEGEWWVELSCTTAFIRRAPFAAADDISKVVQGAAMQEVFEELRCGTYYRNYYAESRAQQAKLDLYDFPLRTDGVSGKTLVEDLNRYCATALGFVLIEDIVYHVTDPHVQSAAEMLCMWEQLLHVLAERARRVVAALMNDSDYTELVVDVFRLLRRFVNIAVASVFSVRLSPVIVSRALEVMSDNIISTWLQEACVEATQVVASDTLQPITVTTMKEYQMYVERFSLNRCESLEIPIPPPDLSSGSVVLPYALMVPRIGEIALRFLDRCHSIIEVDNGAVVRQSEFNNVDEMLLKYLSVLFRTVTSVMQGNLALVEGDSMMKLAVYVTSCAAMPIILSCVEQQFVFAWPDEYDGLRRRKKLGEPHLLESSSSLFAKEMQNGIERLLPSFILEVERRLKPTEDIIYWKQLVDARNGFAHPPAPVSGEAAVSDGEMYGMEQGLTEAMDYIIAAIPKLTAVLQMSVARSVLGTVITKAAITIQANIEKAICSSAGADTAVELDDLRACTGEFERMCSTLVPQWQERIGACISGLSVTQRFPLNPKQIVGDLLLWISAKEAVRGRSGATN